MINLGGYLTVLVKKRNRRINKDKTTGFVALHK
jgi:hypothetical protein